MKLQCVILSLLRCSVGTVWHTVIPYCPSWGATLSLLSWSIGKILKMGYIFFLMLLQKYEAYKSHTWNDFLKRMGILHLGCSFGWVWEFFTSGTALGGVWEFFTSSGLGRNNYTTPSFRERNVSFNLTSGSISLF